MADSFADAVVVAAGSSRRMGNTDKLEAPIVGRPLLQLAVEAMLGARSVRRVVLVTAPAQVDRMRSVGWLGGRVPGEVTVVGGGDRRSDSVLAGVQTTDADVVLVHDGARPLASAGLADAVADAAARHGAAVPVIPVVDSLKRSSDGRLTGSVDRHGLVRAQTPQAARRTVLLDAFAAAGGEDFTDEAALLESHGVPVATVPGEAFNVKVTDPADLELVRAIATARAGEAAHVGFGQDSHQFGSGDGLWLGGVLFDGWPRLHGHSDGDVALHALATAILAAAGLGDLGRLFPDSDRSTAGAPSADLLAEVVDRSRAAGWRLAGVQVSLVGARPRLGAERLDRMRVRIGELTGLTGPAGSAGTAGPAGAAQGSVAVVASTGNLSGDEGAGRAISASAVVTMVRE